MRCASFILFHLMWAYGPAQAYSAARVNQELAKEGIPLPFGNRLWAANWPHQKAPFPGLVIHLITTVSIYTLVYQFYSTLVQGHSHYRASSTSCIPFYIGCFRIPSTDHLPVCHSRVCFDRIPFLPLLISFNRVSFISGGGSLTCTGHSKARRWAVLRMLFYD
jgi:hypothetical protein